MQEKRGARPRSADLSVQQYTRNHQPGAQRALVFRVVIEAQLHRVAVLRLQVD